MEQHTLFARGQIPKLGAQGHVKYKNMWNDLSKQLNRIGPSQKTVNEWQKVNLIYIFNIFLYNLGVHPIVIELQ